GGGGERRRVARAVTEAHGPRDAGLDLAVEEVARNVELRRAHLEHGPVEAAPRDLGHALGVVDVPLVPGDLGENRQLLGLLEAAEPRRHGAGLGRDEHDRRVRPVGCRDSGDEIRDARSVLRNADAMATRGTRITVRHVDRALLVSDRDELDAGRREEVERGHEGGADDAEDVRRLMGDECLHEGFGGSHLLRLGHGRTPSTSLFRRDDLSRWGRTYYNTALRSNIDFLNGR